ncbi:alanine racemase [Carnobacterium gallinarum]|uniref:alanine racemase n=1 Tax=Carnobacterium gallinarum TaxID=2749 RepID=UPI00054DCF6F|nr:alanine racemase [Carnobacterium gallinarum]
MISGKHRDTVAIIHKDAIYNNLKNEMNYLEADTEVYAVVKANGYGHGALEVAEIARQAGVNGFCVAILDEALELRHAGFTEPILILGIVDAEYADLLAKYQIRVNVSSLNWLKDANRQLVSSRCTEKLSIHLAIDTGMGRIGLRTIAEVQEVEVYLSKVKAFNFEGIFTHFATADIENADLFESQADKFEKLVKSLKKAPPYIHSANSATGLWHLGNQKSIVRLGIAMYGLNPSGQELELPFALEPAMSIETKLVAVKQMHQGDTISYGATYKSKEGEWIGTLPIGYADGWRRSLQGQTVLVEGYRCEIVGRVCMDQCMIRLPKEFPLGTKVVLVGKSQQDEVTMQELAEHLDTIHYEITCGLTARLPRVYQ